MFTSSIASADEPAATEPAADEPAAAEPAATEPAAAVDRPAFETNVLWPFFPGGLADFKVVVPLRPAPLASDLTLGAYSDFAWRFVRDDAFGRVSAIGAKIGWRQFALGGLHAEAVVQLNWRHEEDRPDHPETLNGFQGRAWIFAGYQRDVGHRVYLNSRLGLGLHLFRTDELGGEEKKLVPAADLNLGIRL
jgi:hypothetical protein